MNREEITKTKKRIQIHFLEGKYLKAYDLSVNLLRDISANIDNTRNDDFFYCYIQMSNCYRRLSDINLNINYADDALEYAETALKYAVKDNEFVVAYDAVATCYQAKGEIDIAIAKYNECIDKCDEWLDTFDIYFGLARNRIKFSKANAIHNKGDLLKDIDMIVESIKLYSQVLYSEGCDTNDVQKKINDAYDNIYKINPNFIHSTITSPIRALI